MAPLQALYAWYSGNAAASSGGKTNGEGAARRVSAGSASEPGFDPRAPGSGGTAVSGLSGLSSLFDGNSPAEVEAAMHRDAMRAAAAAAVQAARGGVTARDDRYADSNLGDPAPARKRAGAGARRGDAATRAASRD